MAQPAKAEDVWPLVQQLPRDERMRLIKLALAVDDAAAYRAFPPSADEFGSEDDAGSWEPEGWEDSKT